MLIPFGVEFKGALLHEGVGSSQGRYPLAFCGTHTAIRSLTGIPWWVMMFNARHRIPTSFACCFALRLAIPPPKIVFIRDIAVSPSERRW